VVLVVVVLVGCGQGGQGGQGARRGPADPELSAAPLGQAPLDLSAGAVTLRVPLSGRRGAGLVVADRRVLVLGGQRPGVGVEDPDEGLADGVFYDLDRQSWWALPDLPVPLYGMAGLWSGSEVVVVGTACVSSVWVEEKDASRCRPGGVRVFTWTPGAQRWEEHELEGLPVEFERSEGVPWEFNPVGRAGRWLVFAEAGDTTPAISSVGDGGLEGAVLWFYDPERDESRWVRGPGGCPIGGDLVAYTGAYHGGAPVPDAVLAQPLALERLDPDRLVWQPVAGSQVGRPVTAGVFFEAIHCMDGAGMLYTPIRRGDGDDAVFGPMLWWSGRSPGWRQLPALRRDKLEGLRPGVVGEIEGTVVVWWQGGRALLPPGASEWVLAPAVIDTVPAGSAISGVARAGDLLLRLAAPERSRPRPGGGPPIVEYEAPFVQVVDLRALAAIPTPAG
jgi:hypothetical protein